MLTIKIFVRLFHKTFYKVKSNKEALVLNVSHTIILYELTYYYNFFIRQLNIIFLLDRKNIISCEIA
jgi:hypothetical protein